MFGRLPGILLALCILTTGCNGQDRESQAIRDALAVRSNAINTRNLTQYLSVVSQRYNDKGKSFAQLAETLKKNFGEFEQISYEADPPSISVKGGVADSVGSYRMKVRIRGREITLNGTEHLRLVKETGEWKIIAGI